MAQEPVTIMAPLLFLVVTELSAIGRGMNLHRALRKERSPLGIPILDSVPGLPPLGRFNFIHGANLGILSVGLFLITLLSDQWIRWGTTLLTWVVFVIQPVLEIDEYSAVLESNDPPIQLKWLPIYSFHIHFILVTILTLYVFSWGKTVPQNPFEGITHPTTLVPFFPVLILLVGLTYIAFLWLLKKELRETEDTKGANEG